jgi:sugar phosphate permease
MGILGSFIHRISLKTYIIWGLLLASISYMLFSVLFGLTSFFNVIFMTVCMCLNGFFQATGWPGMMGIFGNWFKKNKKGAIMGIWAMNANFGNIVASNLCNLLEENGVSWVWNFVLTGLFAIGVAVLMFFVLKEKPEEEQTNSVEGLEEKMKESMLSEGENEQTEQQRQRQANFGILSVLCLPRVPAYVIGYSCLKGCIYGLLFWLPTFFDSKGSAISDQKGYISAMIDIGSLIGGTAVGFLADKYNKRALFLSPLLFLSAIIMFVVSYALTD